jgi:flagellum-specific ATP synthase
MSVVDRAMRSVATLEPRLIVGSVHAIRGLTIVIDRLRVPIGSLVEVDTAMGPTMGEVIGFDGPRSLAMLFSSTAGVSPGSTVRAKSLTATVAVGPSWLGRVLDALGRPIDSGPPIDDLEHCPLDPPTVNPLRRGIITHPLPTGVRAIDGLLTVGRGQRLGIFAGPGVGKSTLLASIARGTAADVVVIGLVGERGREVKEFLEHTLGTEGRRKACVVTATGDDSPLLRVRAASAAIAAAEYFRSLGKHVLLMIDSITRLAQAQRQIGLAAGEQPATKGFTPSVFALLPKLLERAGPLDSGGSITGFYTVLVEGDDLTEPIADAVKGILDGHIVLSRKIASRGEYPAIDVLESISRVADNVSDENHRAARREIIRMLAARRNSEELINIGAYVRGSNADIDTAEAFLETTRSFLEQDRAIVSQYPETLASLVDLAKRSIAHRHSLLTAASSARVAQPQAQRATSAASSGSAGAPATPRPRKAG